MNTTPQQQDNKIFKDAFMGVLLIIGAIAYSLIPAAPVTVMPHLMIIPAVMSVAGLYLLYKAIKNDRYRLKEQL